MKLWFKDRYDNCRIIKDPCNTIDEVFMTIDNFLNNRLEKSGLSMMLFKVSSRHDSHIWTNKKGHTYFEVGSHSELFIWEGNINETVV